MKTRLAAFLSLVAGLCLLPVAALAGIGDVNSLGWTVLTPSGDSRLVYVSSSDGNDADDGLTPATAKATIDAADALIRDGYPDWMLLKRGDTFPQPNLGRWKNGRSASEPMVLTCYGATGPRPIIKLTDGLVEWNAQPRNNQAFVGLDLYRSISDPDSPDFTNTGSGNGLYFNSGSAAHAYNVLVEDCRLRFCALAVQGQNTNYFTHNAHIRRNIILNTWAHGSTDGDAITFGLFVRGVVDVVIEENLFHHNGWSEVVAGAGANQYNHNVYMQNSNDGDILVRGNVFSFGSAHGLQLRSGGTAVMNAFVGNAIGMNVGYSTAPLHFTDQTVVDDNVLTDGRPQIPNDSSDPQTGAIWGIWRQSISNFTINGNIVANILDNRGVNMRPYSNMTANQFGSGNIAWNWVQNNEPGSDPGWMAPTRNADNFGNDIGLGDWAGFIAEASDRGVGEMPYALSAYAYVDYIRVGFNKGTVTPPYQFASAPQYTYLQLEVTGTTNSTEGRIREIDWRVGAAEYPNPHYTGASGNITHTGNVGWEAYDGLVTAESYWKLLYSTTGTITLQLGSAIAPTAIRIRPVNQDRAPSGFIVRGSNNGTSWTVLKSVTGLTPSTWSTAGNDVTFTIP